MFGYIDVTPFQTRYRRPRSSKTPLLKHYNQFDNEILGDISDISISIIQPFWTNLDNSLCNVLNIRNFAYILIDGFGARSVRTHRWLLPLDILRQRGPSLICPRYPQVSYTNHKGNLLISGAGLVKVRLALICLLAHVHACSDNVGIFVQIQNPEGEF